MTIATDFLHVRAMIAAQTKHEAPSKPLHGEPPVGKLPTGPWIGSLTAVGKTKDDAVKRGGPSPYRCPISHLSTTLPSLNRIAYGADQVDDVDLQIITADGKIDIHTSNNPIK